MTGPLRRQGETGKACVKGVAPEERVRHTSCAAVIDAMATVQKMECGGMTFGEVSEKLLSSTMC